VPVRISMRLAVVVLAFVTAVAGQVRGRLAELTAKGIADLEQGKYTAALNALEEVWEQDQSDPAVAENLAMAYLYAEKDAPKARSLAEHAIRAGGKASFLVQHPHEKVGFLSGDMADFCAGRIRISKDQLIFTSKDPRHSFVINAGGLKEIKANRLYGSERGMYHLQTTDKRKYNFRPRNWSQEEQELMLRLVKQHIKQE
jgi:hypothetical protein